MPENFMGMDGFVWFVGVVEDRNDPEKVGRVRVRCLGFHTDDLTKLPTADLPWAMCMHPITDPSMHGMGNSPSFLLEGSWVIGFFRDAESKQQPVILGSLPGIPNKPSDHTKGFNDPRSAASFQLDYAEEPFKRKETDGHSYGPYPLDGEKYWRFSGHKVGEPDTNRLARGKESEKHWSMKRRRLNRLEGKPWEGGTGVSYAKKPYMSRTELQAQQEKRKAWEEPLPKGIEKDGVEVPVESINAAEEVETTVKNIYQSGLYPWNHVYESEAGHIMEIDDTPGGERLYKEHGPSGTFEEIHPTGTRVVKIIGDDYEIVAGSSYVVINGNANVTIKGDKREFIKGDYVLEVEGEYTQRIGKDMKSKVGYTKGGGNLYQEIVGNHEYCIKEDYKGMVNGAFIEFIKGNSTILVAGIGGHLLETVHDMNLHSMNSKIALNAQTELDLFSVGTATMSGIHAGISATGAILLNSDGTISAAAVGTISTSSTGITSIQSHGANVNITSGKGLGYPLGDINLNEPAALVNFLAGAFNSS